TRCNARGDELRDGRHHRPVRDARSAEAVLGPLSCSCSYPTPVELWPSLPGEVPGLDQRSSASRHQTDSARDNRGGDRRSTAQDNIPRTFKWLGYIKSPSKH